MIPKIIHQTAPADKTKWHKIWIMCQYTWKLCFPDWEYKFWSDEDLDTFIKTEYNWFYDTYIKYPNQIFRVDAARYFILYHYGGLYADMDYECFINFEHLLHKTKVSIAESNYYDKKYKSNYEYEIYQNALMASPIKHDFWTKVFKNLIKYSNDKEVLNATGPQIIIRTALKFPEMVYSLDRFKFTGYGDLRGIYSIHHGTVMYLDKDSNYIDDLSHSNKKNLLIKYKLCYNKNKL